MASFVDSNLVIEIYLYNAGRFRDYIYKPYKTIAIKDVVNKATVNSSAQYWFPFALVKDDSGVYQVVVEKNSIETGWQQICEEAYPGGNCS